MTCPSHFNLSKASTIDIPNLLQELDTSESGLWESDARKRLIRYGQNSLIEKHHTPPLIDFLNNFTNPLIITLLVIAAVSFFMDSVLDSIIVVIMVLLSVTLNFIQEYKASRASEALQARVAQIAIVYRHGCTQEIPAIKLVPGDVVELNAGDLIPADGRILESKDFFVNQASLTGESFPVEKYSSTLADTPHDLNSMHNMVFSGTSVNTGWAKIVILATGKQSQFGKLSETINDIQDHDEFSENIHSFSRMIIKLIIVIVTLIFGLKAIMHHDIWSSLQFAVAIAVGLTPEFLPMILSVTMGKGSVQMAKKGVIVKRLTAIPTFGSMDVLCTDKTGTLTENKIALIKFVDLNGLVSAETLHLAYINSTFQSGINSPMDDAVKLYGHTNSKGYEKIDEIPYDFERRRLTIVVNHQHTGIMITKGAPESMASIMTHYIGHGKTHPFTPKIHAKYTKLYHDLSEQGFRVLAVAKKQINPEMHPLTAAQERDLTFSGFIAFLDPPKKGVITAINELASLGIDFKVISGDNELVTEKICREIDINIKGILLGSEVDLLSDTQLGEKVEQTTIFARFSPEQKNRVIKSLQMRKHVVGYLGDGINDAPSLLTADVGISVANAVDVAREASDFVLTKKSLHQLTQGVREGRKTFANTMKYILMGLSSNFGNMFSMLGAVIFLPFLPMLPMQILLNNFLYDCSQITIPTDNVDEAYIARPKRMNNHQIRLFMMLFGPVSSIFDFITFGVLYFLFKNNASAFQTGWFMESLATQTLVIFIIRTKKIPFIQSMPSQWLGLTSIAVVVIGWTIASLPIGQVFGFSALSPTILFLLALIVCVYLVVVEFVKRYYQKLMTRDIYAA